MREIIDHATLDALLRDAGSSWSAAQSHGLLCGQFAVHGQYCGDMWRSQVLAEADPGTHAECAALLNQLAEATWTRLAERQSQFDVLLPDDDEDSQLRAQALADWAEGFLHGLVTHSSDTAVRKQLAEEPLADLIRDLLELTRADVGEDDTSEETDLAYAELVEYLRVAAQLAFEHLADARNQGGAAEDAPDRLLH